MSKNKDKKKATPPAIHKETDRTQAEEMAVAAKERRQPACVHCGHPLNRVRETQHEYISWVWDAEEETFYKDSDGDSDKPYHDRAECPDGCGVHDPEFSENGLIFY
jgi:hypothetical protein